METLISDLKKVMNSEIENKEKYMQMLINGFIRERDSELLTIQGVVKSLPSIIEIDFDGHLKCQIETTDKTPTILKAVNGYGQPVDCNKDNIRINEI